MIKNFFSGRPAPIADQASVLNDPTTLYFAYGSNLHLLQMAQRCPGSVFVGLAILRAYRWQINERGVANVVPVDGKDQSSQVEGLVFRITHRDEAELDRFEGVQRQLYEKKTLSVQLHPHPQYTEQPTAAVSKQLAMRLGDDRSGSGRPLSAISDQDSDKKMAVDPPTMLDRQALVYVSERYNKDGTIRDEYVSRMLDAVRHAVALGVSKAFVDQAMMPHLVRDRDSSGWAGQNLTVGKHTRNVNQERQEASGNAAAAGCADNDCTHSNRLCRLRRENRLPHAVTGVQFHADLLAWRTSGDAEGAFPNAVYVVVLQEPIIGATAGYSVEAVTQNLVLANELAIKYFRDACTRFEDVVSSDFIIGPPVKTRQQLVYEPGTCSCFLDNNRCSFFVLTLPNGGGQLRAWVTVQELLE